MFIFDWLYTYFLGLSLTSRTEDFGSPNPGAEPGAPTNFYAVVAQNGTTFEIDR